MYILYPLKEASVKDNPMKKSAMSGLIGIFLVFCLAIPAVAAQDVETFVPGEVAIEVKDSSVLLAGMDIAERHKGEGYVSSNLMVTYSMGPGKVASTASVPSKYSSTGALIQADFGDGLEWYYLKDITKEGGDVFEGKEKATVNWEYPLLENQDWKPASFRDNLAEIPEGGDAHFIINGDLVLPGQFIIYSVDDDDEKAETTLSDPEADCSSPGRRCSVTLKTSELDEGYYYIVYTWQAGGKTYVSNSMGVMIGSPGNDGNEQVILNEALTGKEKKLLWTPKYAQYYGTWGNTNNKEGISVYAWSDSPSGISIGTSTGNVAYDLSSLGLTGLKFEVKTDWKTYTTLAFSNNKKIDLALKGSGIILKPSASGDWGNSLVLTNSSNQRIIMSKEGISTPVENTSINLNDTAITTVKTPSGGISGITIDQIDLELSGLNIMNSNFGRLAVSPEYDGYLNMYTDFGWVVRNLYLNNMLTTTYFDLGNRRPLDITTLSAYIDIKDEPRPIFLDGPRAIYIMGNKIWDAEGINVPSIPEEKPVIKSGPAMTGGEMFVEIALPPAPENYTHSLPNVSNKEAADNQCVPMSVANSLQYLEDAENIGVPDEHKMGLKGDDSLVGKLDKEMNRGVVSRKSGTGVWFDDMLEGKFSYLKKNGLGGKLINKHQGRGYGAGAVPNGNFTSDGITSRDDGDKVTFEWLCQQIKDGEDVEIIFSYEDAAGSITGGHAVRVFECGKALGAPWVGFAHDRDQSNDTEGLETPRENVIDSDGDGTLNIFGSVLGNRSEIVFAVSESAAELPAEPPAEEKGVLGRIWGWITSWF